jgi:hypothetical protein
MYISLRNSADYCTMYVPGSEPPSVCGAPALHPPDTEKAMKKLSLDIESLAVESFETLAPHEQQGTVHGAESPSDPCSWPSHCGSCLECSAVSWCVCYPDDGTTHSEYHVCG